VFPPRSPDRTAVARKLGNRLGRDRSSRPRSCEPSFDEGAVAVLRDGPDRERVSCQLAGTFGYGEGFCRTRQQRPDFVARASCSITRTQDSMSAGMDQRKVNAVVGYVLLSGSRIFERCGLGNTWLSRASSRRVVPLVVLSFEAIGARRKICAYDAVVVRFRRLGRQLTDSQLRVRCPDVGSRYARRRQYFQRC